MEKIKVSNGSNNLKERLFLTFTDKDEVIAVSKEDEASFFCEDKNSFRAGVWKKYQTESSDDLFPFYTEVLVSNDGRRWSVKNYVSSIKINGVTKHLTLSDSGDYEDENRTITIEKWDIIKAF